MEQRQLGKIGPMVSRQGLGCMGMSIIYGQPDDAASLSTLHKALDLGVNMIVTSDAYGNGVNETLVGKALAGRRDEAVVCTKFGNLALAGGGDTGFTGGHPSHVMISCDRSLKRLGVDVIDLYALHRVDPTVPIEDTVSRQARVALPFRWMVQAPQEPTPQPNLVPSSLRLSRKTQSSGVSDATSTFRSLPLM
jgi:aryl-alcohol dehydrogenase-like predicted oxidoreductase